MHTGKIVFAKILIAKARKLYAKKKPIPEIDGVVYTFDSTTISLCLELFPWAEFRKSVFKNLYSCGEP